MTTVSIPETIDGLENLAIKIDPDELAQLLIPYVVQGSQKNSLSVTDLTIVMPSGKSLGDDAGIKELWEAGSDFFSSVIYQRLSAEFRSKITLTTPDLSAGSRILTQEALSTLLFCDFFYIFTQARHPTKEMDDIGSTTRKYKPAQFILNTIGNVQTFAEIEEALFVKGLAKIPMEWVKKVPMTGLSLEAQNRFLLGAAGHRLIQAFATIRFIDETPADVQTIWAKLIKYTQDGYSWNFHTAFRTVNFVKKFKSLNKILEYLLAIYGRPDDVAQAVSIESKVLFRTPTADSRYKDYSSLVGSAFDTFANTEKIFA